MRRRDFTIGLLLAAAARTVQAQEPAKQHRIAIFRPAGPVSQINANGNRFYRAFFAELRRLGEIEGQNLTVERYSSEGRPDGYPELARQVVGSNPDVIVAITNPVALAIRAATATTPVVLIGVEPIRLGLSASVAHPGGNLTGVDVEADVEIWGKRLQILKEAVPSASKVAFLTPRGAWEGAYGQAFRPAYQEASRRLQISLIPMLLEASTPSEYRRAFFEIARDRPNAILVSDTGALIPDRQLIVELVEKYRLPAMYPWREYVEVGGLMAYEADLSEAGRRMADDVHDILNGAKPGDIPIYQPTKYELVINLKAANALGLTLPPSLIAAADEVIE